ncbi:MAG: triose-phosphate isomerase [Candidatus Aenigmarchaeota archaeon]|nr:triose-phosphate isomerase [Candidatus Aenigmarchaeota archaeon]MDW8149228.1 triose-phosphate isomerase [Candidatus Aenigmarchaeota archaeon]
MIIVNFKNYLESSNKNGIKLVKICEEVSKKFNVEIIACPNFIDIKEIVKKAKIKIFSQHIDPIEDFGAFTGSTVASYLKNIGVKGSLINHSEKPLKIKEIKKCVEICKKLNLTSVVLSSKINQIKKIVKFKPNYIAYEPKELIGGDISVSTAKPKIIKRAFEICRKENIKLLVGAGIKNGQDVKKSRIFGAKGILVSSGVVKAKNPKVTLEDFARNIKIKGLFVGRFQPLHLGHVYAINQAFDLFDEVIVGIGSSQYSNEPRNPFSAKTREKMIKAVFKNRENLKIVKIPDFNNDEIWTNYCLKSFDFDVVFTGSKHVIKCFEGKKEIIKPLILKPRNIYRGTFIRKLMKENDEKWKELVPKEIIGLF